MNVKLRGSTVAELALTKCSAHPIIRKRNQFRLESCVRPPIPHITTLVLLVHMAFGCCMHHSHACETACCETPVAVAETCPCGGHQHDDKQSSDRDEQNDNRPHQHSCEAGKCVFMQSETHADIVGKMNPGDFVFATLPESVETSISLAVFNHLLEFRYGSTGPPLRTHLLNQALLI